MPTRLLTLVLLIFSMPGFSQYLANPSFEGVPLMIGPPPDWYICDTTSTPNVQPGKYAIYLPPSDGITYIGLLTRENFTWEDMYAPLEIPLSKDSCYMFKIDLAFQQVLSFTIVSPIVLRIYGSNVNCQKENVLWESAPISNIDWQTSEFMIHNTEFDITDLILETYYVGSYPYWGYMLIDNIRINPTPFMELGNDTTLAYCENDSIILDPGPGFYSYLWQDGSMEQTYVVDTTGLFWVQVFNQFGCSWTDSIYVTYEEYIEMESQMSDSTLVCEDQEVTLSINILNGVEPYSYQWLNLPDTTQAVTVTADSTMFYYVTVTDHCGYTLTDSIKLVVIESPNINLGPDTLICADGDYTLSVGGGYLQYLWQDGSLDSTYTVTQPGIYWVQVISVFGCVAIDSVEIDVFPPIQLDIGDDTTLCVGETLLLNAGGDFMEYLWQDNSTDTAYTVNSSGTYWVTVTDINGCHATDTVHAEFLSLPIVSLGADTSLCQGDELVLNAGLGFLSYLWQDNSTGQLYTVTQGGTYWVSVDNGCGMATDSINIILHPKPQPNLGPDTTICMGEEIFLNPGGQYSSYIWQDNSTLAFYTATSTGVYSVTVENSFGCEGEDEVYISISEMMVELGDDKQLCAGDTVFLNAGAGFESYLWQDNSTESTLMIYYSGQFNVSAIDEFGCESKDTVTYTYYPYPNPGLGDDLVICEGESTILEAPEGDFLYYWNGVAGNNYYEVSEPGTYTLAMANPCDSVSEEIEISVVPIPYVYLGADDVLVAGQTIELNAGSGFDEYLWQDGTNSQFFVVTENNIEDENPYFYVDVWDGQCKNSDTIKIERFQVWVPNAITPNNDGYNDRFIADPETWSGINKHTMTVFNRWGEKVWESNDFVNGWDGRRNGKVVADGTYFWILEVYYGRNNFKKVLKGNVTVLGSQN